MNSHNEFARLDVRQIDRQTDRRIDRQIQVDWHKVTHGQIDRQIDPFYRWRNQHSGTHGFLAFVYFSPRNSFQRTHTRTHSLRVPIMDGNRQNLVFIKLCIYFYSFSQVARRNRTYAYTHTNTRTDKTLMDTCGSYYIIAYALMHTLIERRYSFSCVILVFLLSCNSLSAVCIQVFFSSIQYVFM